MYPAKVGVVLLYLFFKNPSFPPSLSHFYQKEQFLYLLILCSSRETVILEFRHTKGKLSHHGFSSWTMNCSMTDKTPLPQLVSGSYGMRKGRFWILIWRIPTEIPPILIHAIVKFQPKKKGYIIPFKASFMN